MSEAKPTPGEWEAWTGAAKFGITGPAAAASMVAAAAIKQSGFGHFVDLASSSQECPGIALGDTKERAIANANLFADAGNTYNTTGLTPSQLVEQRDQLVERVKKLEEDAAMWRTLMDLPGATRRIWNHVLDDDVKENANSIREALAAVSKKGGA